jgi:hypothetical protein
VNPAATSDDLTSSAGDVVGDWRDAVESGVSEATESARRYRSIIAELADRKIQELRRRGERRYFALRRDLRGRTDRLRRQTSEQPLQFIATCAAAAFAMGIVLRIWRSNHE